MRPAADDPDRRRTGFGHVDRGDRVVFAQFGADTLAADIGFGLDGHMDDAENRAMIVDQGNIDRELAIAVDEFPGAVQGVDQPVLRPLRALGKRRQSFLLRNDRNFGGKSTQAGDDTTMRGQIGLRQR